MSELKEPTEKVRNNYLKKREELYNLYNGDVNDKDYKKKVVKLINSYQKKYPSSDFFRTDKLTEDEKEEILYGYSSKNKIQKTPKEKKIKKESDLNPDVVKYLKGLKKTLIGKRSLSGKDMKYYLEDDYNMYLGFEIYNNGEIEEAGFGIRKNEFIDLVNTKIESAKKYGRISRMKYFVRFHIHINLYDYMYGPLKITCIINKVVDNDVEEEPYKIGTIYYTNDELMEKRFNIRDIEVLMNALLNDELSSNPIDINTFSDLLNIKNSKKKVKVKKEPKEKVKKEKEPKQTSKKTLSTTKILTAEQIKSLTPLKKVEVKSQLTPDEESRIFRLISGYALNGAFSERSKPSEDSYPSLFNKIESYVKSLFKKIKGKHYSLKSEPIPDKYSTRKEKWNAIEDLINKLYINNSDNKLFINLKNHFNKLNKEYREERPEDFLNLNEDERKNIISNKKKELERLENEKERLQFEKEMDEAERLGHIIREETRQKNKAINLKKYKEEYKQLKRKIRIENETGGAPKRMVERYKELKQLIEENKNNS